MNKRGYKKVENIEFKKKGQNVRPVTFPARDTVVKKILPYPQLAPTTSVVGVWRYRQVVGSVYVQYNEHTKKVVGLAMLVSGNFVPCGLNVLIAAVNESEKEQSITKPGRKVRTSR